MRKRTISIETDDTGTYRLFGLAAGEYVIGVETNRLTIPLIRLRAVDTKPYGYYPRAAGPEEAEGLVLGAGTELRGIDFRVSVTGVSVDGGNIDPLNTAAGRIRPDQRACPAPRRLSGPRHPYPAVVRESVADTVGIIIPDSAKEKPQQGQIIAVGKGRVNDKGQRVPLEVKVGDRILFGKYSQEITLERGVPHLATGGNTSRPWRWRDDKENRGHEKRDQDGDEEDKDGDEEDKDGEEEQEEVILRLGAIRSRQREEASGST